MTEVELGDFPAYSPITATVNNLRSQGWRVSMWHAGGRVDFNTAGDEYAILSRRYEGAGKSL